MRRNLQETQCVDRNINMILPFNYEQVSESKKKKGIVSSEPGERVVLGIPGVHMGMDFRLDVGTDVLAPYGGEVVKLVNNHWDYGNYLVLKHQAGDYTIFTLYAHLNSISKNIGDILRVGDKIGESGSTGRSTGPHLHFEVIDGDVSVTQTDTSGDFPISETYLVKKWISDYASSNSMGIPGTSARLNPRDFFCESEQAKLIQNIKADDKQKTFVGSSCSANNYISNQRDNKFIGSCDLNILRDSAYFRLIQDRRRLDTTTSDFNPNTTDIYSFPRLNKVGNDWIYDDDLDARLELGGTLINNATLVDCVVEADGGDVSDTVWRLKNGDHDVSGIEYIATRVDDSGVASANGGNLRISFNSAEVSEDYASNSVTIYGFDFDLALTNSCCGIKRLESTVTVDTIKGASGNLVYADNAEYTVRPRSVSLPDGGVALVWESYNNYEPTWRLQARVINADRTVRSDIINVALVAGEFGSYDICLAADGGFAVVWKTSYEDDDRDDQHVYSYLYDDPAGITYDDDLVAEESNSLNIRFYNANAVAYGDKVSLIADDNRLDDGYVRAAYLESGNIVITYVRYDDDTRDEGVYALEVDSGGNIVRDEQAIVTTSTNSKFYGSNLVVALPDGGYLVSYQCAQYSTIGDDDSASSCGVYKLRVSSDGELGSPDLIVASTGEDSLYVNDIVATSDGGYLFCWTEHDGYAGSVYAKVYDANGVLLQNTFLVSDKYSEFANVGVLNTGEIMFSFQDSSYREVWAQIYNAEYELQKEDFLIVQANGYIRGNSVVELDGYFNVIWSETVSADGLDININAAVYDWRGVKIDQNYTLTSSTLAECVKIGSAGDDQIVLDELPTYGREGKNTFLVSEGNNNVIRDFVIGKDKIDISSLELNVRRTRRRLQNDNLASLYVNATQNSSDTNLQFLTVDGHQEVAQLTLTDNKAIDLAADDFNTLSNSSVALNVDTSDVIGIRGNEVVRYVEDDVAAIPPLEVALQAGQDDSDLMVQIKLNDNYGSLSVTGKDKIANLRVINNESAQELILYGDLASVNAGLANVSFSPDANVNEAVTATFNVSVGESLRSETLRMNGIAVNDAPIWNSYLDSYQITEQNNATVAFANVSDVDNSIAELSVYCVNDENWFNASFDDVGNVVARINAPQLPNAQDGVRNSQTYQMQCYATDGELNSGSGRINITVNPSNNSASDINNSRSHSNSNNSAALGLGGILALSFSSAIIFGVLLYCAYRKYGLNDLCEGVVREQSGDVERGKNEKPVSELELENRLKIGSTQRFSSSLDRPASEGQTATI